MCCMYITHTVCFNCQLFSPYVTKDLSIKRSFPGSSDGKESACNVGDQGLIPGLGRSPGEGNGYPVQYSCLGNSMDRGAWQAAVQGVAKSWTRLSNLGWHFFLSSFPLFFAILSLTSLVSLATMLSGDCLSGQLPLVIQVLFCVQPMVQWGSSQLPDGFSFLL